MKRRSIFIFLIVLLITGGCYFNYSASDSKANGQLKIIHIDVGQGDASLFIGPTGKVMLIDTGVSQAYGKLKKVLEKNNCRHIDVLIGTHPDEDHIGGISRILQEYPVGRLYINGKNNLSSFHSIQRIAKIKNLTIHEAVSGNHIDWEKKVFAEVIGPKSLNVDKLNNVSLALKITYGEHSFLFMGDAEKEEEKDILNIYGKKLMSNVLKVGHHGSSSSSTPAFINIVKPQVAIISVGKNSYGHPDSLVMKRLTLIGADVYSTEKNGNITFESNGKKLWISVDNRTGSIVQAAKS